ncbi:MAG: hypothetical protein K6F49_06975 [Saccharofermentans sp.]|nr:hypothetical protein [Saccharofermentans sp.]
MNTAYACQEIVDAAKYYSAFDASSRTKPMGTGHTILPCDGIVDSPFAVINAVDYYGKNGFSKAAYFLGYCRIYP